MTPKLGQALGLMCFLANLIRFRYHDIILQSSESSLLERGEACVQNQMTRMGESTYKKIDTVLSQTILKEELA